MTASVIVPAHDESAGLRRCLTALLADARAGEFDVVVVPNGCSDDTADVARHFANRGVRCVEIEQASKIAALRAGDAATDKFPRIYLDADVSIDTAAARAVVDVLTAGGVLAAAPRMELDLTAVGPGARRYLRVWQGLPVFAHGYVGSGCYALSAQGRAQFAEFPDVIGDDQFVNELFRVEQKTTLAAHRLRVAPARTLRAIVRRSLRVQAGRLAQADQQGQPQDVPSTRAHLVDLARRRPGQVPDLLLFCAVQATIIGVGRLRRRRGIDGVWLRDETSRSATQD